jgi:predicted Zn-dependent protease
MIRRIFFAIIVAIGVAALVWSERHPVDVRANPAAILYFIADSEWELTRLPMVATRLSDEDEIKIGNQMAANIGIDRRGSDQTPEQKHQARVVELYVARVGRKVAARAHRKLPYRLHYIPDINFVNAFALPGGHVYIGAGLLAQMDSEDELAAVLGHEIEHIDHYHCAERVQAEQRLRRVPLGDLAMLPAAIFEAGYSKDQELEADREGTQLAVWAGYSPLGALRMFETFDRLYQEYVQRAKSPQEELSQVAIDTLQGYFRSHPLPSERIEQIRRMITDNNWGGLTHERDFEVAYVFWTDRAQQAYDEGHYDVAVRLAQHSLELHPEQPIALTALGNSQFALANFSEAAAAYRQVLDRKPTDPNLLTQYTDALMARHTPAESLEEYASWLDSHPAAVGRSEAGLQTRLELGRLTLAAKGDAAADKVLFPTVTATAAELPPQMRGRYGWWFYEVGEFDLASKWLQTAVEELPGDVATQEHLGWALIEQHNLEGAMQRFESASNADTSTESGTPEQRRRIFDERRIGLAVAEWQAQQHDRALGEFNGVVYARTEWLNPKWVAAFYSPGVVKTLEEIKAEQKKRNPKWPNG